MKLKNYSLLFLAAFLLLLGAACTSSNITQSTTELGVVYRSPTWGCCGDWIAYMEKNGYSFKVEDVNNLSPIKHQYNVPSQLQSCHTAIVDGYIIEGHVPVAEVERLLKERPPIAGIAVGGMPLGSPGMEVDGGATEPFDVVAFDAQGNTYIYASYGK